MSSATRLTWPRGLSEDGLDLNRERLEQASAEKFLIDIWRRQSSEGHGVFALCCARASFREAVTSLALHSTGRGYQSGRRSSSFLKQPRVGARSCQWQGLFPE